MGQPRLHMLVFAIHVETLAMHAMPAMQATLALTSKVAGSYAIAGSLPLSRTMEDRDRFSANATLDKRLQAAQAALATQSASGQKRQCITGAQQGSAPPASGQPLLNRGFSARAHVRSAASAGPNRGGALQAPSLAQARAPLARGSMTGGAAAAVHARKRVEREEAVQRDVPTEGAAAHGGENGAGVGLDGAAQAEPTRRPGVPRMRHRLYNRQEAWKAMITCNLVISWVCFEFPFKFLPTGPPPMSMAPNHNSVRQHATFVSSQVEDLLAAGTVVPWKPEYGDDSPTPHLVCPLKVVVQNGKERLFYDARMLNAHLFIPPFKYEDLSACKTYIKPNDWVMVLDLSKGYHHMDIHPDYWRYLGFKWNNQYYVYTGMPFGVATAPWAFTKK